MASVKGSRTEKNLLAAFAGEAQAAARYGFFAKKAKKEGFEQIGAALERTALEEQAHASVFYKLLEGGSAELEAAFAAGGNWSTRENLEAAAAGEREEASTTYPEFARVARAEGFDRIAAVFAAVAVAEQHHERRHRAFLDRIETGTVFHREAPVVWRCRKCGFLHTATDAPVVCAACAHPQAYFEVLGEDL